MILGFTLDTIFGIFGIGFIIGFIFGGITMYFLIKKLTDKDI